MGLRLRCPALLSGPRWQLWAGLQTLKQTLLSGQARCPEKGQRGLNQPLMPAATPPSGPGGRPFSPGPHGLTQPACSEHLPKPSRSGVHTPRSDLKRRHPGAALLRLWASHWPVWPQSPRQRNEEAAQDGLPRHVHTLIVADSLLATSCPETSNAFRTMPLVGQQVPVWRR